MTMRGTLFALVVVGSGLAPALGRAQESAADASEGQALFESHQCWQCHGYEGQGGVAGLRIAPMIYPLVAFAQLVRHTTLMPAYSPNVLSDEQLEQIYEYLRSIPEPPALEDIPELNIY